MQECGDEQQLCFFTIKTLLTKYEHFFWEANLKMQKSDYWYEADKCPGILDMNNEASNWLWLISTDAIMFNLHQLLAGCVDKIRCIEVVFIILIFNDKLYFFCHTMYYMALYQERRRGIYFVLVYSGLIWYSQVDSGKAICCNTSRIPGSLARNQPR